MKHLFNVGIQYSALWVKVNGEEALGISERCLSFYSHSNISDGNFILVPHFNHTQYSRSIYQGQNKHILIFLFSRHVLFSSYKRFYLSALLNP